MRRGTALAVAGIALVAVAPAPPSASAALEEPEVVIEGKGFGHGVGMPQDGAYAMGLAGAGVTDILATFYPGTIIGQRSGRVRVQLFDRPLESVVFSFPAGGEVREDESEAQPAGLPVVVSPGGSVSVSFDGEYRVTPLDGADVTRPAPPASTPAEPVAGGPLRAIPAGNATVALPEHGRRYRGTIAVSASGGGLQLVNTLDVEHYLRGMGEVRAPSWPAASLQAQAIAARTYALRYAAAGQTLCSSQQCQVYVGQTAEYGAMNQAVADTTGQVVTYGGALIETVYSASGGGITATPEEGFGPGSPSYPYLQAVPYPTQDPQPWEERLSLRRLAARAGYAGEATDVKVTRAGPSGRPLEITFTGDGEPHAIGGHELASRLGLQSTLFTIRVERPADPVAAAVTATSIPSRLPALVLEAGGADHALGRWPWVALALVLLVAAAGAIVRTGPTPATAGARRRYSGPQGSTAASPGPPAAPTRRSAP